MKTPALCLMVLAAALACRADEVVTPGVALSGVVEDASGAVVRGAKLTLTNNATGAALKTKADAQGNFRFESVPAGEYTLKAKADSLTSVELPVKVADKALPPMQIRMEVQASRQEVTVTSEGEPEHELSLEPSSNADAMRLEEGNLTQLPVDNGDLIGTVAKFLSPAAQGGVGPSIVVDGVETSAFDAPAWAIKRIRINKNPYSAQFRRPGKSRIEVTTRDGRANFHGGFSAYVRNSALDARNALAATKPDDHRGLFETHLNGPLSKSLFFSFSGERLEDRQNAIVNVHLPTGPLVENAGTPLYRTSLLGRLDFHRTRMHWMNLRYSSQSLVQHNRGVGGFDLPEVGYSYSDRNSTLQFADRYISSANFSNQFRIQAERGDTRVGAPATAPLIIVQGRFHAGESQQFRTDRETTFRLQDDVSYYKGRHLIQFGDQARPRFVGGRQQTNFGGTYEFSGLGHFEEGKPFVYRLNQGDPTLSFKAAQDYEYFQDQIQVRPNLTLLAGVRHEWQSSLNSNGNREAPRLSLAYAPGRGRTILRAGAGVFYETLPKSVTRQRLLYDGVRVRQFVLKNPTFPDPFADASALLTPQSVVRMAPQLGVPTLLQASFGIEQGLGKHTQLTVEYQRLRGVHLYRTRNINEPVPPFGLRPFPDFGNIVEVESTGTMQTNSLDVSLRWNAKRFSGMAHYTLARSLDNAYPLFSLPANNYDVRPEWGPADYDRRHQFNAMGSFELPGRFRLGSILTFGSALPYNITTGHDGGANERPDGIPRNARRGAGMAQIDLRLTKAFPVYRLYKKPKPERNNLEFSIDAFNLFNHTNFDRFVGVLNSPYFGRANVALAPRTLQTSMRYSW